MKCHQTSMMIIIDMNRMDEIVDRFPLAPTIIYSMASIPAMSDTNDIYRSLLNDDIWPHDGKVLSNDGHINIKRCTWTTFLKGIIEFDANQSND
jgi:hypothetical protein